MFNATFTGVTYNAAGSFTSTGGQIIILIPSTVTVPLLSFGDVNLTLTGTGFTNSLVVSPRIDVKLFPASSKTIVDVTIADVTFMDRNLGGIRAATSINVPLSFGNYYQWGRGSDNHELVVVKGEGLDVMRLNGTTNVIASTEASAGSTAITTTASPNDWFSPSTARWNTDTQGSSLTGYRLPNQLKWIKLLNF